MENDEKLGSGEKKKQSNRKETIVYLPLAIERVLLDYTDKGKGRSLSYSEITQKLKEDFDIDVDVSTVRKAVPEIRFWWQLDSLKGEIFSIDIENENCRNKKRLISVGRRGDLENKIEYLVRYLESLSADNRNMDIQTLLLSPLDLETQESINAKVKDQKRSELMPRLSEILDTIQRLETAINEREYLHIDYLHNAGPEPDKKKLYLPLCVCFVNNHYYLAAKNKKSKFYIKGVASPRIFRIDKIVNLEQTGKKAVLQEGKFEEWQEASRRLLKAGLVGTVSGGVVRVKMRYVGRTGDDEKIKGYILNAIRGNPEFEETMGAYSFVTSREGFERWLPKWIPYIDIESIREGSDNKQGSWDFDEKNIADEVIANVMDPIMNSEIGKRYVAKKSSGQ